MYTDLARKMVATMLKISKSSLEPVEPRERDVDSTLRKLSIYSSEKTD